MPLLLKNYFLQIGQLAALDVFGDLIQAFTKADSSWGFFFLSKFKIRFKDFSLLMCLRVQCSQRERPSGKCSWIENVSKPSHWPDIRSGSKPWERQEPIPYQKSSPTWQGVYGGISGTTPCRL